MFHGAEGTWVRASGCQESGGVKRRFGGSRQGPLCRVTKGKPKWQGMGLGRRTHSS